MRTVSPDDIQRIRDATFFEGPTVRNRLSRYWWLLGLAAVIATAGVISDSTATVIGAMIVAPLMAPIMGIVVATVLGDHKNLLTCLGLVVLGMALVIGASLLFALVGPLHHTAANNSQIASRVNPGLVDLVAALATGAVGAFALCRSDVADTLPGVAIAISLVPPLCVVGITLEAGAWGEAAGAMLLFATNVAAILLTGFVVMALYKVPSFAAIDTTTKQRRAIAMAVGMVLVVAVPLAVSSYQTVQERLTEGRVDGVATKWAAADGWEIDSVTTDKDGHVVVLAKGPLPAPDTATLRQMLDSSGERSVNVVVHLTPEQRVDLPPA